MEFPTRAGAGSQGGLQQRQEGVYPFQWSQIVVFACSDEGEYFGVVMALLCVWGLRSSWPCHQPPAPPGSLFDNAPGSNIYLDVSQFPSIRYHEVRLFECFEPLKLCSFFYEPESFKTNGRFQILPLLDLSQSFRIAERFKSPLFFREPHSSKAS